MKNLTIIFLVMFCFVAIHNPLFSQAPTGGLVAYYPFTSGGAYDESGNGRHGSQNNGVSYAIDRYGNANRAVGFDGTGYMTIPWGILTGNAPRSISLWFKCSVPAYTQYMLSWGTAISSNTASRLGTYFANAGIKKLGFNGNGEDITVDNQLQYLDNRWHHLTFTYDGTKMSLFIDALLVSTKNSFPLNTGNTNLIIGANSSYLENFYVGALDEVRTYNRALTTTEVQQSYLSEAPTTSTAEVIKVGADRFISTAGTANTMVGIRAGAFSSGQNNSLFGHSTALSNTGSNNLMVGTEAGNKNTAGNDNVFMGYRAGYNNTPNTLGSQNIYVGSLAGGLGTNGGILQRSGAIGYNARVSINDAIVLGDFQNNNLKVGIGVHDPQHRLDVKGVINMRAALNSPGLKINGRDFLGLDEQGEFVVSNFKMKYKSENQWADRVFKNGYVLMPLAQLEEYIKTHEHLPGIPTASEAVEKGVSTQEMTAKLLEKVEELTRYVIELKKENESLKKDYQEVLKRLPDSNK